MITFYVLPDLASFDRFIQAEIMKSSVANRTKKSLFMTFKTFTSTAFQKRIRFSLYFWNLFWSLLFSNSFSNNERLINIYFLRNILLNFFLFRFLNWSWSLSIIIKIRLRFFIILSFRSFRLFFCCTFLSILINIQS